MGKHKNKPKKASEQAQANLQDLIDKLLYCCSTQLSSFKEEWNNFVEINKYLEAISEIEKDIPTISYDRYDNLECFLSWCKENGAVWDGIKIEKIHGKDLGVMAEKDLKEGSLYLKVPRKLMLSTENASSKLGNLAHKDVVLRAMPNVLLAFYLLIEACDTESFWKPYISILPSSFSTVLYFTPKELESLQTSPTLAEAVNLRRSIARQYAYLYKLIQVNPDLKRLRKHFTYNFYRWAVSCVMTRQNAIPMARKSKRAINRDENESGSEGQNELQTLSLVPLWDLCNHEIGKFSTDFNLANDELECFAMKDFKNDEEVTIFYGPRPNSELFIHSGFVIPYVQQNIYDTYSLKLGISSNDPCINDKSLMCEKLGLPIKGTFVIKATDQLIDQTLLNFCKISTMDKQDLELWLSKSIEEMQSFLVDETLNKKAVKFLQARLTILMMSYKTTLEDDESITLGGLSENERVVIFMRLSEKKLLKKTLDQINLLISV